MSLFRSRRPKTTDGPPDTHRSTSSKTASFSQLFSKSNKPKRSSLDSKKVSQGFGVGIAYDMPRPRRSSVSSDSASLQEIRRPSGLGERAESRLSVESFDDTSGSMQEADVVDMRETARHQSRPWSIAQSMTQYTSNSAKPYDPYATKPVVVPLPVSPKVLEFPMELLSTICAYLTPHDLSVVACVSKRFVIGARKNLYESLDLHNISFEGVDTCISTLVLNRSLASLVRSFVCPKLPLFNDDGSPLPFLSFSIALYNMLNLTSLSLPRFDPHVFHHTSFRLERAVFWCEEMSEVEQREFSKWLAHQQDLLSLALPVLKTDILISPITAQAAVNPDTSVIVGNFSLPIPLVREPIVPKLAHFEGPMSLVPSLVPGRPVTEVIVHVHKTLYDGLKPFDSMASLAKSSSLVTKLSIFPSLTINIDLRSLERSLTAAGAGIGPFVRVLEIGWALEEDVLYKILGPVICTFTSLHTLHLRKMSCPTSSISSSPSPVTPISSYLLSLPSPFPLLRANSTPSSRSTAFPVLPVSDDSFVSDLDDRQSREHNYLKQWARSTPSLVTAVFLSTAEWCVVKRLKRAGTRVRRESVSRIRLGVAEEEGEWRSVNVLSFVRWRVDD